MFSIHTFTIDTFASIMICKVKTQDYMLQRFGLTGHIMCPFEALLTNY